MTGLTEGSIVEEQEWFFMGTVPIKTLPSPSSSYKYLYTILRRTILVQLNVKRWKKRRKKRRTNKNRMLDYYGSSQDGALNSFYTPDYHPLHPCMWSIDVKRSTGCIKRLFFTLNRTLDHYRITSSITRKPTAIVQTPVICALINYRG